VPELPEVETTRRGLAPHLTGHRVSAVVVREARLRWPVPAGLAESMGGRTVRGIDRRGKYLIFNFDRGHMLVHLGMSGSLRIGTAESAPGKHDHLDWRFSNNLVLRFHDPRRFGSVHWVDSHPDRHPLLASLGPEPLSGAFNGDYLFARSRRRRVAVKNHIMDAHTVTGVGNIYASEALFAAGIRPGTAAGRLSRRQCAALAGAVKRVLHAAIEQGGTTLRDFVNEAGAPGYFRQRLRVYERGGQACRVCSETIKSRVIGQRASYYCPRCQR
jgi:formamidopyrimidine-DNA glycosylase